MVAGRLLPFVEMAARLSLNMRGIESRMVDTGSARLHLYDARGQGALPSTVVLHGLGSAATPFGRLLLGLRPHVRRVLVPDLPGHGFSEAPGATVSADTLFATVAELLDPLAGEPLALVGNSLGGALALRYALEHPGRLRALILISPAGAQMTPPEWQALLESFRMQSVEDARRLLSRLYHRTPIYMPVFASGLRDSLQRKAVVDMLQSVTPLDLLSAERLGELTVPTLLLWGQSERLLPASSLAYFRRHLPAHVVIEEPAGFGHCPHIDDPARLAQRVVDFIESAESGVHVGARP
jgi:pimeloyl-ACP methyl ester carboxylesterase